MTKRKPDPKITAGGWVSRPHFACRLRIDLADLLRAKCRELNCSQGVYLEILIARGMLADIVRPEDVYQYSAADRWLERALSDYITAKVSGDTSETETAFLGRVKAAWSRMIQGTT